MGWGVDWRLGGSVSGPFSRATYSDIHAPHQPGISDYVSVKSLDFCKFLGGDRGRDSGCSLLRLYKGIEKPKLEKTGQAVLN